MTAGLWSDEPLIWLLNLDIAGRTRSAIPCSHALRSFPIKPSANTERRASAMGLAAFASIGKSLLTCPGLDATRWTFW